MLKNCLTGNKTYVFLHTTRLCYYCAINLKKILYGTRKLIYTNPVTAALMKGLDCVLEAQVCLQSKDAIETPRIDLSCSVCKYLNHHMFH